MPTFVTYDEILWCFVLRFSRSWPELEPSKPMRIDGQTSTGPRRLLTVNCSPRMRADETIATMTSIKTTSAERVAFFALS
jgi:hypothetical protein